MTFERYMGLCLYHSDFGYYTQGRERTGVTGDYFTSSDLHPVFARLVARQAAEMWELMGRPKPFMWVEMGAGRGLFTCDFLRWAKAALPEFDKALEYIAIEPGGAQQQRIKARLTSAGLEDKVRVCGNLEELGPVYGCFFSNELVDAFPVSVVTRTQGHLKEVYVTADESDLREKAGPISDPAIAAYVARYAPGLEEGHRMEVSRFAQAWMKSVAAKLTRGFVVTVDYGDLANRLFTADRPRGTLLAYHAHTATENFFSTPGETDLTAHVNFSALIDAGKAEGLEFAGFTTQEKFLMALGEANQFADIYDPGQTIREIFQARLKLKTLISPEGMGTTFKILLQGRGMAGEPLTGWKYARTPAGGPARES